MVPLFPPFIWEHVKGVFYARVKGVNCLIFLLTYARRSYYAEAMNLNNQPKELKMKMKNEFLIRFTTIDNMRKIDDHAFVCGASMKCAVSDGFIFSVDPAWADLFVNAVDTVENGIISEVY